MIKKQNTIYSVICLAIGIIGGIAGTAFSMGAEQQRIRDALIFNNTEIAKIQLQQTKHEMDVDKEMDRYTKIITAQTIVLHNSIRELTSMVNNLRTDVHVLKALMERMEEDLKKGPYQINTIDT